MSGLKRHELIGELTILLMASPLHRNLYLHEVADFFLAALDHNQFRIYRSNGLCVRFDTSWHNLKTKFELDGKIDRGLTLHGLRHMLGTLLKEAAANDGEIADVLGQSTVSMARHYSKEAGI